MKTFTVAGTSVEHGTVKFRVANDLRSRIAMLTRCENTEINLVELPEPMTKQAAAAFLLTVPEFAVSDAAGVIAAAADRVAAPSKAKAKPVARRVDAVVEDDDGFVEPKDERIQVAMSRKAREYPGLTAHQLYEMVMMTVKEFGATEPNF
jgi:hypothetical protein